MMGLTMDLKQNALRGLSLETLGPKGARLPLFQAFGAGRGYSNHAKKIALTAS
jgi:hypothetical protein